MNCSCNRIQFITTAWPIATDGSNRIASSHKRLRGAIKATRTVFLGNRYDNRESDSFHLIFSRSNDETNNILALLIPPQEWISIGNNIFWSRIAFDSSTHIWDWNHFFLPVLPMKRKSIKFKRMYNRCGPSFSSVCNFLLIVISFSVCEERVPVPSPGDKPHTQSQQH